MAQLASRNLIPGGGGRRRKATRRIRGHGTTIVKINSRSTESYPQGCVRNSTGHWWIGTNLSCVTGTSTAIVKCIYVRNTTGRRERICRKIVVLPVARRRWWCVPPPRPSRLIMLPMSPMMMMAVASTIIKSSSTTRGSSRESSSGITTG